MILSILIPALAETPDEPYHFIKRTFNGSPVLQVILHIGLYVVLVQRPRSGGPVCGILADTAPASSGTTLTPTCYQLVLIVPHVLNGGVQFYRHTAQCIAR